MDNIRLKVEELLRKTGELFRNPEMKEEFITTKGFANFVTHIDFKVQDLLVAELEKILPGSNIITEEAEDNRLKFDEYTWILDPVDGTTNLMYDYHHSAISLALFINGEPSMGFIYNPYMDEMFIGVAGSGAWVNERPIKVTSNTILEECLVGFGTTPYDRSKSEITFNLLTDLFSSCRDIRRSGSAALDLAYVACGRMDVFFEYTLQPWDYAAGMIILTEAGGKLTDWSGSVPGVVCPSPIVATNSKVHGIILDKMNKLFGNLLN